MRRALRTLREKISNPRGLSMIELLIVIVIISTLFLIFMMMIRSNIFRAHDAERKAHLEKMAVAFEEYYNDEGCYPPPEIIEDCGGDAFDPYLDRVPCDPVSGDPYLYVPNEDRCSGYRLYATLADTEDPDVERLSCDGACGCGFGPEYNYGVSSGVTVDTDECLADTLPSPSPDSSPDPDASPDSSPESSASPDNDVFACTTANACNQYSEGNSILEGCTTYDTANLCTTAIQNNGDVCPDPCEAG